MSILLDLYPGEFGPFCCGQNAMLSFKLSSCTKVVTSVLKK